jgi:hypothetical protein
MTYVVLLMKSTVDAYARFQAMGAVLTIARLPIHAGGAREAAVHGMRLFAERYEERLAALNPGRDVSSYFHITIEPDVELGRRILESEEIGICDFFGPGYDIDADEVTLFRYTPGSRSSTTFDGLAHALLDPPYGLRSPDWTPYGRFGSSEHATRETAWMRDVLREFCTEVLALDDPKRASHLRIHRWPTNWSSYFDAGHEWWGASYWTVEDTHNGWITVIGASSSD